MKLKTFIFLLTISINLLFISYSEGQIFAKNTSSKQSEGKKVLKRISLKEKQTLTFSYIFSKNTNYYIDFDFADEKFGYKDVKINLYNHHKKLVKSNFIANKAYNGIYYECKSTGIYEMEFVNQSNEKVDLKLTYQINSNNISLPKFEIIKPVYTNNSTFLLKDGIYQLDLEKKNNYIFMLIDENDKLLKSIDKTEFSLYYQGQKLASNRARGEFYPAITYKTLETGIYTLVIKNSNGKSGQKVFIRSRNSLSTDK